MLRVPLMIKLMMHAMAAYGPMLAPNISIAIMLEAMGVFVVPASRLTSPIAAKVGMLMPVTWAKSTPAVEPTANIGVMTPPLPPKPSVVAVNRILAGKEYQATGVPCSELSIKPVPRPRYWVEKSSARPIKIVPPINPLVGDLSGIFKDCLCTQYTTSIMRMEQIPNIIPPMMTSRNINSLNEGTMFNKWLV